MDKTREIENFLGQERKIKRHIFYEKMSNFPVIKQIIASFRGIASLLDWSFKSLFGLFIMLRGFNKFCPKSPDETIGSIK